MDIEMSMEMKSLKLIDKALNKFLKGERGKVLSDKSNSHIEVVGVLSKGETGVLIYSVYVLFKYELTNKSHFIYKTDCEIKDLESKDELIEDTNSKVLSEIIKYIKRDLGFWDELVYERYKGSNDLLHINNAQNTIPNFITGTPEERIEKWKAYLDSGIILSDSSDDENWIEYGDLSYEDFERCGFSLRYNMGTWDVYTKVNIYNINLEADTRVYIKYNNDNKRLVVIADNDKTLFDGIIKTNYEFYKLMRQLDIIESESEPEIEEEPKPELNAETGNISCSDELIGIATLGGPISGTISPESYYTSCTVSLYDSFLIDTIVKENSIELVYKEVSIWNGLDSRVYKIVYSCLDGKWHKSDRIYGEIIPKQVIEETYKF